MQHLMVEVDDELAQAVLNIARRTGHGPDYVASAIFHLGTHMLSVVETLNFCPAVARLYQSEP